MSADEIVYVCVIFSQFSGPTHMRMKLLLSLAVLGVTLRVLYSAPDGQAPGNTEDTLKREAIQRNTGCFQCRISTSERSLPPAGSPMPFFHIKQRFSLLFEDFSSCCFDFFYPTVMFFLSITSFPILVLTDKLIMHLNKFQSKFLKS